MIGGAYIFASPVNQLDQFLCAFQPVGAVMPLHFSPTRGRGRGCQALEDVAVLGEASDVTLVV